jgi:hypothetical protein
MKVEARPDADENAYEELRLLAAGGQEKSVHSQLQSCGCLGAAGLEGLFWSANSRYFYYTDARAGVPDGCGYWQKPIFRLDIRNLHTELLGGALLAPDRTKLAAWQEKELVIWDVDEGKIASRIPAHAPNFEIGPVAWSPESNALVYVQTESSCPASGTAYLVQADSATGEQTRLLEFESPTVSRLDWAAPEELRLFDENGRQWGYTFGTQDLEPMP